MGKGRLGPVSRARRSAERSAADPGSSHARTETPKTPDQRCGISRRTTSGERNNLREPARSGAPQTRDRRMRGPSYPRPRISGAAFHAAPRPGNEAKVCGAYPGSPRTPGTDCNLETAPDQRCGISRRTASGERSEGRARVQSRIKSAYRSRQSGLRSSTSLIFQSRRQRFTARSRSLACKIEAYSSK
jgi:hypothetical protein